MSHIFFGERVKNHGAWFEISKLNRPISTFSDFHTTLGLKKGKKCFFFINVNILNLRVMFKFKL